MAEQPGTARERLLDAAIGHVAAHGLGELSLRQLAAALGTSHRMLVYHFGSKAGLLVEVVRAVEARQRAALAAVTEDQELAGLPLAEQMREGWRRFADPALWPHERLFFEVYELAFAGRRGQPRPRPRPGPGQGQRPAGPGGHPRPPARPARDRRPGRRR
jgi:AcrR family transcriptional regulator